MPRAMEIVTPLGPDVLLFHRMHAREELSRLSDFRVELLSHPDNGDIDLDKILGQNVTIRLGLAADSSTALSRGSRKSAGMAATTVLSPRSSPGPGS
jgi:uncharacterized protein involved in type VI secretion and phage assembly